MSDEETQIVYEEDKEYVQNDEDNYEIEAPAANDPPEEAKEPKKKRERKEVVEDVREPGKSLFPVSRVQKIIKADKDIPIVAKEATFLIALATEEFIKHLCEASHHIAHREKRSTVQHKDIATAVRKAEEFMFLEEILPWSLPEAPSNKRPRTKAAGPTLKAEATIMDQFIVGKKGAESDENDDDDDDVIMNEDGTMYAAGTADDDES